MGKKQKRQRAGLFRGEMEILAMLWKEGPLTLSKAHQRFAQYGESIGYPTMQTRLNRLVDKELVRRSNERPAIYQAAVTQAEVGLGHLAQFMEKVGSGMVVPLVAHLLSEADLTAGEIKELRRLLSRVESKKGKE